MEAVNFTANVSHGPNVSVSSARNPFPTESLAFKAFKLTCYTMVFLVGVIGNILVFRMVLRRRKLQTVSNYLICNLAAADIAVLMINLPARLAYQENSYIWPFGAFLCKIIPMLTYLFLTASSATLVLMTFDQHRAVVSPLKRRFTITKTKVAIFFIWVFSALVTSPLNFALALVYRASKPVCTDVWPSDTFEKVYFVVLFIVQFVVPFGIITTAYADMCKHLRTSASGITAESHNDSTRRRTSRNKKVIKMLITIVLLHAVFTLPHHITWLLSVFGHPNSVAKKLCVLLVIALSAAHPIIYGTLNKDFKRGFRSYVECFRCRHSDTKQQGLQEEKPTAVTTRI